MDINKRRAAFRFNSLRTLLELSIFEVARLLDRSHITISGIERGIKEATDAQINFMKEYALSHNIEFSKDWLKGIENSPKPKTLDRKIEEKIQIEQNIENCLILIDSDEHKIKFGKRILEIMKNLGMNIYNFSKWCGVSHNTVERWTTGKTLPKKDVLRKMLEKIEKENLPISPEWLCIGKGTLENFQYTPLSHSSSEIIKVKIETADFEPHIDKNSKLTAMSFPKSAFVPNWKGFYLFLHNNLWTPVRIESTKNLDKFHIISLHNRIGDQLILKDISIDAIYPIVYYEESYPVKQKQMQNN